VTNPEAFKRFVAEAAEAAERERCVCLFGFLVRR